MQSEKSKMMSNKEIEEFDALLHLDMSPIKKERIKKRQKQLQQQRLRENLPVLTLNEIRRHRLPYYQALLLELQEDGLTNTAESIKQFLDMQEKARKKFGPGTVIWLRPQLQNSKENLDHLVNCLSKAEKAHKAEQFSIEWDERLRLAAYYAFGSDDWWWLGEQLLYECASMEYPREGQKQECISYFIMGKYLVENGKKMENGRYYLDIARDTSQGKSWTCAKILNQKQEIIFIESCKLLFKTLYDEAVHLMKTDAAKAADICNLARKRAAEACDHHGEFEALLLRGRCELLLNQTTDAVATMTKALNRSLRKKTIRGICEAKIALALAYLQHGKANECFECLKDLKVLAEENSLNFYLGQAYRFMGEYYLNQNKAYEATPLLLLAFYIFNENRDVRRREKVRTWAAISAGEELFPAFIHLIRSCDASKEGHDSIIKLIRWIDDKEFFWTQHSKFSFSYASVAASVLDYESASIL